MGEQLATLAGSMMKNQEYKKREGYVQDSTSKKRRLTISAPSHQLSVSRAMPPSPVKSHVIDCGVPKIQPLSVTSLPDASTTSDADLYMEPPRLPLPPASPFTSKDFSKESSMGSLVRSLSEYDEDILATLLALDDDNQNISEKGKAETEVPDTTMSLSPSDTMEKGHVDSNLVEQLLNVIASPEAFQKQVEAVSALAHAAATEAKARLHSSSNNTNADCSDLSYNKQSSELATAALGAFLARYGADHDKPDN